MGGDRWTWMGAWVAVCATGIMFYYSVVTGWCLRYLWAAGSGELARRESAEVWASFAGSSAAAVTQVLALGLAFAVVWFGVRGIERACSFLIPFLFLLVLMLAVRAVTLSGAEEGLRFLFSADWATLGQPEVWLQALTQNAWDTGAGWGLIVTYAVYMRAREDVPLNSFLIGFGNNSVSLLSGIMVLCTVFALNPGAREQIVGAGNEGLTFEWMPRLFAEMPGGSFFMVLFFLALSVAALTSLISMFELSTRVLIDFGLSRRRALTWVALAALAFGLPSARSMTLFRNQDWVWSVGLMLSGLFFALAARRFGLERLRDQVVNDDGADLPVGGWWSFLVGVVVPLEAVILVVWWLWSVIRHQPVAMWIQPFAESTAGTLFLQWGIVLIVLLALNRWMAARLEVRRATVEGARP
jgi:NSS family neurotransmitter:Na+ symporter